MSFNVRIIHLYIFFWEMSVQILCPFKKVFFWLLSCVCSLFMLDRVPYQIWFVNTSSCSVDCLITFLIVSFEVQMCFWWSATFSFVAFFFFAIKFWETEIWRNTLVLQYATSFLKCFWIYMSRLHLMSGTKVRGGMWKLTPSQTKKWFSTFGTKTGHGK